MHKLIAVDLDGTMLNSYGEVTENTKKILKEIMQKGNEVVITTGRTMDAIQNIAEEIESRKYIIAGNGAIIYDTQKKENIYEKNISKNKVLDIIKICEDNSIIYSVYTNKTIISRYLRYNVLYYYKENMKKTQNKKTSITLVDDVYEYVKNMKDENVIKIFICDETKSIFNAIIKKLRLIDEIEVLDVGHMSRKIITDGTQEIALEYFYTEITAENVDKWYAIEKLMEILKIKKEDVIVVGDNINDKKMIEAAGIGIAMKGSSPEVTKVANYITEFDNDNDGAAIEIEKIVNGE